MLNANDGRAYLGPKPSYTREQFNQVCAMLGRQPSRKIARHTKLTRQTIYRIKDDSAGAEAALAAWGGLPTGNIGAEGLF